MLSSSDYLCGDMGKHALVPSEGVVLSFDADRSIQVVLKRWNKRAESGAQHSFAVFCLGALFVCFTAPCAPAGPALYDVVPPYLFESVTPSSAKCMLCRKKYFHLRDGSGNLIGTSTGRAPVTRMVGIMPLTSQPTTATKRARYCISSAAVFL